MIDEVTFAGANLLHQYGQGVAGEEADQRVAPGLVDWAVQKIRGLVRRTDAEPAYDRLVDGRGQDGDPDLVVAALRDAVADDPRHLQTLVDVVRHLRAAGIEFPGTLPPVGADDLLRVRFARPADPDGEAVPGRVTRLELHLENRSDRPTRVTLRPFGDHAAQVRAPSTVDVPAAGRITVPVLFEIGTVRPAAGRAVVRVGAESPELGRRTSARTVEIPARPDWSIGMDPRASLGRAHPTPVALRIRNTGNTTWVRPVIELSGDDRVELDGDTEHPLGDELTPGSEATVRFGAQAATLVGTVPAQVRVELRINGNGDLPARTVSLPVRPLLPAGIAVATVATALGAVLILPAGDRFAALPGAPGDPFRPADSGPGVTVSPSAPPSITPSVRPTSRPTSAPPRSPTPSVRPPGPARTSAPPAPGPGPSAAGVDLLFAAPAQDPVILQDREGRTVTLPSGGAVRQAVKVPTGWLVLRTVSAGTGGVLYVHDGQTDQLYNGTNDRAWVDDGGGTIVVDRRANNTAGPVVVHTLASGGQTTGTLPADADVLGFVGARVLLRAGSANGFDTWQPARRTRPRPGPAGRCSARAATGPS
jgi:hypothetical protein